MSFQTCVGPILSAARPMSALGTSLAAARKQTVAGLAGRLPLVEVKPIEVLDVKLPSRSEALWERCMPVATCGNHLLGVP